MPRTDDGEVVFLAESPQPKAPVQPSIAIRILNSIKSFFNAALDFINSGFNTAWAYAKAAVNFMIDSVKSIFGLPVTAFNYSWNKMSSLFPASSSEPKAETTLVAEGNNEPAPSYFSSLSSTLSSFWCCSKKTPAPAVVAKKNDEDLENSNGSFSPGQSQ